MYREKEKKEKSLSTYFLDPAATLAIQIVAKTAKIVTKIA